MKTSHKYLRSDYYFPWAVPITDLLVSLPARQEHVHCLLFTVCCPASMVCFCSRPPFTFDKAVLPGCGIKLHDIGRAIEAIFGKSPPGGFLIIVVALENARALDAQLARPITSVLTIGINEPVENGSVACLSSV